MAEHNVKRKFVEKVRKCQKKITRALSSLIDTTLYRNFEYESGFYKGEILDTRFKKFWIY